MRSTGLNAVAALAAGLSALTAIWLLGVVATVLPAHDPGGIPGWTLFAAALLSFVSLTGLRLRGSSGRRAAMWSVAASIIAAILGAYILVAALSRTADFEAYLVVIGAIVLLHGIAMLVWERAHEPRPGSELSGAP